MQMLDYCFWGKFGDLGFLFCDICAKFLPY